MKLKQLFETAAQLTLRTDNPGGSWLKNKREDNDDAKPNQFGNPSRLGPVTGSWNKHVLLPVDLLAKIKGLNDEQGRVRQHDFDGLKDIMGTTKRLPMHSEKQYPPFVVVLQDGRPWVSEGNHRIMVAKHLGWKYMPIELRYFTGGEGETGILSPDKIKKYNAEAERLGFNVEDFHAELETVKESFDANPSFEEILYAMKKWFGIDFGLRGLDISTLHSDPKIAAVLSAKADEKLRAAIKSNKIDLRITSNIFDIPKTATLSMVYTGKLLRCKIESYAFDIHIMPNIYTIVDALQKICTNWFIEQDNK